MAGEGAGNQLDVGKHLRELYGPYTGHLNTLH